MSTHLSVTVTDGIACLSLERPPVNGLSADFLMGFAAKIHDLSAAPCVKAIVITSPYKVLSAGLDLKDAQTFDIAEQHAIVEGLNRGFLALYACPKPTLCAVNGAAIAGGLFFVLASDYRVATPRAQFGLAEVRVGADFPAGPLEIARASLDANTLRKLMLTGLPIRAEEALRVGVIDEIADAAEPAAQKMARHLASIPPQTYASVKRQIRGHVIDVITAAMDAGANAPTGGWFTEETKPAMAAMIAGRT